MSKYQDRAMELRHDPIIRCRFECDDFAFALDEQPHGHRLHATCRERRSHPFPKYGRQLETDQPVEYAAGLLGVYQIHVHRAGGLDGFENGPFGDFVEDDAFRLIDRETQHFGQVPCDGFSLAVFIGREPHGLGLGGRLAQFAHQSLLLVGNLVHRTETMVNVDTETLAFQIAHMSVARHHFEVFAQKLLYGFCLGRRLDDD